MAAREAMNGALPPPPAPVQEEEEQQPQQGQGQGQGRSSGIVRGHWRPHEDAKLRELVREFGPQNWNLMAEQIESRSGIQE